MLVSILPLISGVLQGLSALFSKKVANFDINPIYSAIVYTFGALVVTGIGYSLFGEYKVIYDWRLLLVLLNALLIAILYAWYYKILKHLEVSHSAFIERAPIPLVIIAGVVFLGESFTVGNIVGSMLILIGVFVASGADLGRLDRWSISMYINSAMFAVVGVLDNYLAEFFDPFIYLSLLYSLLIIFLVIYLLFMNTLKALFIVDSSVLLTIFLTGLLGSVGIVILIYGYSLGGDLGVATVLSQIRFPITVIGGILLFKESNQIKEKGVGILLVVLGVLSIYFI